MGKTKTRLSISDLPDKIFLPIIARVPRIYYMELRLVSRRWKAAIMSSELFSVRKKLGTTEEWLYLLTDINNEQQLCYCLDPLSRKWQKLPPLPLKDPGSGLGSKIGSALGLIGRKKIPIYGSSIVCVNGCLYLVGGFSSSISPLKYVWRYDPVQNKWSRLRSSMYIGRAYCRAAALNNKLYVVGGITSKEWGKSVALKSGEVFDPATGVWYTIPSMVSAEPLSYLRPTAGMGMTSYGGKLFVPPMLSQNDGENEVRSGEAYDPRTTSWSQMAAGMCGGWPSSTTGVKLGVVVENKLYGLDECEPGGSRIKVYDEGRDVWRVASTVPDFTQYVGPNSDYLLASFLGKFHVIGKDASNRKFTVLQFDVSENQYVKHSQQIASRRAGVREMMVGCQVLDI